jgi:hypothetical protein
MGDALPLGVIVGSMGASMTERLVRAGRRVVGFDPKQRARTCVMDAGAESAAPLDALVAKLAVTRRWSSACGRSSRRWRPGQLNHGCALPCRPARWPPRSVDDLGPGERGCGALLRHLDQCGRSQPAGAARPAPRRLRSRRRPCPDTSSPCAAAHGWSDHRRRDVHPPRKLCLRARQRLRSRRLHRRAESQYALQR